MTKNTLIIKIMLIEAANKMAHQNLIALKITKAEFKKIAEKHLKQLDEVEELAKLYNIE